MALPILTPQAQQFLPTDIMAKIAAARQAQTQAKFAAPLLQAQIAQTQAATQAQQQQTGQESLLNPLNLAVLKAEVAQIPDLQQRAAAQAQIDAQLKQAQTKLALARAGAASRGPATETDKLNTAIADAQQKLQQFGAKDFRTILAFSKAKYLASLKQFPSQTAAPAAQTAPTGTQESPQNSQNVNSTIAHANNQNQDVTPAQATNEINKAIPASNVATQENNESVQPQVDEQKYINTNATNILKELNDGAEDPFLKAQGSALSVQWKNISSDATQATEKELPLYKTLLDNIHNTNLVGPAGFINWTTPAGQELRANMVRAQGEFIKSFHLGRMTQLEFNFLKNAIGKQTMYPSALRSLFKGVITKDIEAQQKAKTYYDYMAAGGRTQFEADANWTKKQPDIVKNASIQAKDIVIQSQLKGSKVTIDQVHELAKRNNKTEEQIIDILKSKGAF